jgi:hypothetical protein
LKKVRVVSGFIKKSKNFSAILVFSGFLGIVFYKKNHESDLWIIGPRLTLGPWWARRERERRSSGFPPIASLRGGLA